ncbi:MAG: GNAT family N-acetyltransferase [Terrisporobacter sp.]
MDKLKFILSNDDYKVQYLDFIEECREDIEKNRFESCFPLSTKDTIDSDMTTLMNRHKGINLLDGWVPDSVLWMFDEFNNQIIGSVSICHRLTDNLKFRGGHIAYYIKPSQRNKGYGSKL